MKHLANITDPEDLNSRGEIAEYEWVAAEIASFWTDEHENCDNFRFAVKGTDGELHYWEYASNGCCGSDDAEFGPSPLGRTYLWGFNYGH